VRRGLIAVIVGLVACALLAGSWLATRRDASGKQATATPRLDGLVDVHTVTYRSSFDGSAVSALVARPRAASSRGCLIWENGLGSKKEDSAEAAQGFATLGLTTFSIDLRHHGARASNPADLEQAMSESKRIAELIRGTVGDLHSAVGYLQKQPYCRRNVAYAGISLGGIIGTILTATDDRVKAAVLMSTPGTFRAAMTRGTQPILHGIARDAARLAAAVRTLSPLDPARFAGRISPRPVLILSGLADKSLVISDIHRLQAAARKPKTIVEYRGGHDPLAGPAAASNAEAVASFLLRYIVEPTFGVSGNANGTFAQQ
jgi:cephalosporin-C deacetylase-like acetyl esterase